MVCENSMFRSIAAAFNIFMALGLQNSVIRKGNLLKWTKIYFLQKTLRTKNILFHGFIAQMLSYKILL